MPQILDVPTERMADLLAGLDEHVQLVGYRELMDLARQKQLADEDPLPDPAQGGCSVCNGSSMEVLQAHGPGLAKAAGG